MALARQLSAGIHQFEVRFVGGAVFGSKPEKRSEPEIAARYLDLRAEALGDGVPRILGAPALMTVLGARGGNRVLGRHIKFQKKELFCWFSLGD